jgi:hypothetical protein
MKTSTKFSNLLLRVVQVLLCSANMMSGFIKLSLPIPISTRILHGSNVPGLLVHFKGFSGMLGITALFLPLALRKEPVLSPVAASGLASIQIFAYMFHLSLNGIGIVGIDILSCSWQHL